ncbi:GNAT family N-acetyltransferase [Deinococcus aquaedulcis]|uniref:GNAT family N-acetyltransferase n=1 Tax=Deinococcus aquaedulcis TaxID=2840455 RepID=UPI001C8404B1|nr:GNAT family N-acetyltransferase [Deinococcus aquaedulcis]
MYTSIRTVALPGGLQGDLQWSRDELGTLWRLYPQGGGLHLAHAYTAVHGDLLRLNDLHVKATALVPYAHPFWGRLGRRETVALRGLGLGSLLLREIQQEARRRGLRGVTGTFTPERPGDAPRLRAFYTRHGFTLTGTDLRWVPGA